MGLIDLCSNNSYWRGLDYYENRKVKDITKINDNEYDAIVFGSEHYHVHLNVEHPKKSTCTCPHAKGASRVCKHKVAVYFSIFPDEANEAIKERNELIKEQESREREYDNKQREAYKRQKEYVDSLSEEEVRDMLIGYLVDEEMQDEEDPYEDSEWYY